MPRRKQDCPKRMKWEEEALAAAAREAALTGGVLDLGKAGFLSRDDVEGDDSQDSTSPSSSSDQAARDEDEDDDEETTSKRPKLERDSSARNQRRSASVGSSSPPASPVDPRAAQPAAGHGIVSPASAANIQALLAASAAFPGLLSPSNAAGLLAMTQGLPFVNPLLGLSPSVALAAKLPASVLSPPAGTTPSPSGGRNESIIDFSTKRKEDIEQAAEKSAESAPRSGKAGDSPLDLSAGRGAATPKRERSSSGRDSAHAEKSRRSADAPPSHHAAAWAASLLKSQGEWNNGHSAKSESKSLGATSDASRALERMTELSRLSDRSSGTGPAAGSAPSGGRQSAWQSHWLSKGADTAKDVLKCVWCKQSFDSLAALTTHMKESKHCGVNASLIHAGTGGSPASQTASAGQSASSPSSVSSPAPSRNNHSARERERERDAESSFLKETVQLPRKLVRGQDVWLGKGAEQTRQILKCMWCGQSFRSLAEMTTHMQQTQHYTNIISQEQIISWKAADGDTKASSASGGSGAQNHVNAVLTCKVCDQAFSSLKELSSHMVKNSHYKEHIMRSISESGGRRRQARDKRKKALPVRKLLELERAQQEARGRAAPADVGPSGDRAPSGGGGGALPRIPCEKCGEKIDTSIIVEHIRVCVGSSHRSTPKSSQRSTPSPARAPKGSDAVNGSRRTPSLSDAPAAKDKNARSPSSGAASSSGSGETPAEGSSPSVLNAIEKLIEKSFDPTSGKRGSNAAGSNILRRLGIDESMDYTKPLMDPMTVNMLRLYGTYQRERSTSEASSASERVNGSESAHRERDSGKSTPKSRQDDADVSEGSVKVKAEQADEESDAAEAAADSRSASPSARIKSERQEAASPCPSSVSERSLRSATPASSTLERKASSSPEESGQRSQSQTPETRPHASLSALSSMFDGLTSAASGTTGTSSNPLAALQKLCDKTETSGANGNRPSSLGGASSGSGAGSGSASSATTGPGAILAFSWACNDAIMTDSIMKCAFCDTQFISKGAYRHHLSKMHFVKDGPPATGAAAGGATGGSGSSAKASSAKGSSAGPSPQPPAGSSASGLISDESPHSKFLKYTELAKQLSSKYV